MFELDGSPEISFSTVILFLCEIFRLKFTHVGRCTNDAVALGGLFILSFTAFSLRFSLLVKPCKHTAPYPFELKSWHQISVIIYWILLVLACTFPLFSHFVPKSFRTILVISHLLWLA